MFTQGYIKKHRTCLEWRWRKDPLIVALWDFILLSTNFKEANFENLTIQRGQFVTSLNTLSSETGISIRSVRTALKKLESSGELTIKTTSKFSILTIVKYDTYQGSDVDDDTQKDKRLTRKRQATDTQATLIEERKQKEEEKELVPTFEKLNVDTSRDINLHLSTDNKEPCVIDNEGNKSEFVRLSKKDKEKLKQVYEDNFGQEYPRIMRQAVIALDEWFRENPKKFKTSKNHLTRLTGKGLEFQMTTETVRKKYKNQQAYQEQIEKRYDNK